jgi:hypothetical protein
MGQYAATFALVAGTFSVVDCLAETIRGQQQALVSSTYVLFMRMRGPGLQAHGCFCPLHLFCALGHLEQVLACRRGHQNSALTSRGALCSCAR